MTQSLGSFVTNERAATRAEAVAIGTARLIQAGIAPGDATSEAVALLLFALGISREERFLRPHVPLSDADAARYESLVTRREQREPLAYILGTRAFYGLNFAVSPAVLVPRPETEGVVDALLQTGATSVLDLCTGSGAIAVAVAVNAPAARVVATDISGAALAVARQNAEAHGVGARVTFFAGDLFGAVPVYSEPFGTRFGVIGANPPYIAPAEIETLEPEVRDFEPRIALGVHHDALHFYRRIAQQSGAYLLPGGSVAVEVGAGQADVVCALFRGAGFGHVETVPDLAGIGRVVVARFT